MALFSYGPNAVPLPEWAEERLASYCDATGIPYSSVFVTSTVRDAWNQARVMIEQYTWAAMERLYAGPKGRQVVAAGKAAANGIDHNMAGLQAMADKMVEVGFKSGHMDDSVVCIDIDPSRLAGNQIDALISYAKDRPSEVRVSDVHSPHTEGGDRAVHIPFIPPASLAARATSVIASAVGLDTEEDADVVEDDDTFVGLSLKQWGWVGAASFSTWWFLRWTRSRR